MSETATTAAASGGDGPRRIDGIDELKRLVGEVLGRSEWVTVDQETIDAFAEVTGDRQWIHVDRERAARGPFGTTIAHGYLTLSLLPRLIATAYRVDNVSAAINYGSDRVRFPAPLPSGSRIRATAELLAADDVPGGVQAKTRVTVEREDGERPVLVAEPIVRYLA